MSDASEYAEYLNNRVNLGTIVGHPEYHAHRIVSFYVNGAEMDVLELCDDYYSCVLNVARITKLIEWLTARRDEMAVAAQRPEGEPCTG